MSRSISIAPKRSSHSGLIAGIALVVVILGVAVIAAKPGAGPVSAGGTAGAATPSAAMAAAVAARPGDGLTARDAAFDFGPISMAAGKVSHRFFIANRGEAPIMIKKLYTSCMCTTAEFVKGIRRFGPFGMPGHGDIASVNQSFVPGERGYVEVVFDPAAHGPAGVGPIERVVTIESDAQAPLQLAFSAYVTP